MAFSLLVIRVSFSHSSFCFVLNLFSFSLRSFSFASRLFLLWCALFSNYFIFSLSLVKAFFTWILLPFVSFILSSLAFIEFCKRLILFSSSLFLAAKSPSQLSHLIYSLCKYSQLWAFRNIQLSLYLHGIWCLFGQS